MTHACVKTDVIKENNGWYSLLVRSEGSEDRILQELTHDLEAINTLSQRINLGNVSKLHIYDIIEDFLP